MTLIVPLPDGGVDRLMTSVVQRVLSDASGTLFVETRQSVYCVVLDNPVCVLPPPSRMRTSFDSVDITIAPDCLGSFDGAERD